VSLADRFLDRLAPWLVDDDGSLAALAVAGASAGEAVELAVRGTSDADGPWATIMDAQRAPTSNLRWLSQAAGRLLPEGLSDTAMREAISHPTWWRRGSVPFLVAAVQPTLMGGQSVFVLEKTKADGSSDPAYIVVQTYTDETPDTAATAAAALGAKADGLLMTVQQIPRHNWGTLLADYATWTAADAAFASWTALKAGA
jgi:hypothetical protein